MCMRFPPTLTYLFLCKFDPTIHRFPPNLKYLRWDYLTSKSNLPWNCLQDALPSKLTHLSIKEFMFDAFKHVRFPCSLTKLTIDSYSGSPSKECFPPKLTHLIIGIYDGNGPLLRNHLPSGLTELTIKRFTESCNFFRLVPNGLKHLSLGGYHFKFTDRAFGILPRSLLTIRMPGETIYIPEKKREIRRRILQTQKEKEIRRIRKRMMDLMDTWRNQAISHDLTQFE